jgi:hypothetical protein
VVATVLWAWGSRRGTVGGEPRGASKAESKGGLKGGSESGSEGGSEGRLAESAEAGPLPGESK